MEGEMREKLAKLAHEQWCRWMRYMFTKSFIHRDGSITIPSRLAERWTRQLNTKYSDLPEEEKESDRIEADKVINVIN